MNKPSWANTPFPLIQNPRAKMNGTEETVASEQATNMALVHNLLIRDLNSLYLQAPKTPSWSQFLHYHHLTEEEIGFPFLDTHAGMVGLMDGNRHRHEAFEAGVAAFDAYLPALKDEIESYDGAKLRALVNGLGKALTTHLANEIETTVALDRYEDRIDWPLYDKVVHQHAVKHAD